MIEQQTIFPKNIRHHLSNEEWEAELTLVSKSLAASGVTELILKDATGLQLPEWTPGSHIDLIMPNNIVRQYSLCGDLSDRSYYRVAVLCELQGRGGSRYVHEQLQIGQSIRVRGPRNHFPLVASKKYLFIAGGIGITPIIPMIQAVEAMGADWHLIYGGRSEHTMAYRDELSIHGNKVEFFPTDKNKCLPLDPLLSEVKESVHIYTCGPETLLNAVENKTASWPDENIHTERFSTKEIKAPEEALEQFEVFCKRSNINILVGPEKSILDSLESKGIKVIASCRAGVCGTCEVDILEGQADHRDTVLTKSEKSSNEFMLVCCSRSLSKKLVLDI